MTTISIVTISFNQAEFLERTILSVLEQDYPSIEYIVVDPGSTDGSRDVIERYRSRISKIILEPDNGAPDGLNHGFAHATGEILGFLNSDDVLMPGAISSAMRYLDEHKDVDVISGHGDLIGPDDRFLRHLYSDRMSATKFIYNGAIIIQPSTFFRRSIFDRTPGFNANNRMNFDGELFLEMALAGAKFSVTNQVWSGYRIHSQSITGNQSSLQKIQAARAEMFKLATGRQPNQGDRVLTYGFRVLRHILNPMGTWERIVRGPSFGRKED